MEFTSRILLGKLSEISIAGDQPTGIQTHPTRDPAKITLIGDCDVIFLRSLVHCQETHPIRQTMEELAFHVSDVVFQPSLFPTSSDPELGEWMKSALDSAHVTCQDLVGSYYDFHNVLFQDVKIPPSSSKPTEIKQEIEDIEPLPPTVLTVHFNCMPFFPEDQLLNLKHVVYNMLVENHNIRQSSKTYRPTLCEPISIHHDGRYRTGFRFNECTRPDKQLAEIYARHVKKVELDIEDPPSVFLQDLYKHYLRSCLELLAK
eukprot:TRINITY_DN1496_c0_g1_i3.p1 TRINITY_DN1496_c0_g1~~TRINITY_DN1496_c0_g1_i3.p1  ORF type:complete len:260 (-),score=28.76 TRINITY_DN1496_c0_g1_i3:401-1180(-)